MKQLFEFFLSNHISYRLNYLENCWHLTITTEMLAKYYIEIASILTSEEGIEDYIRAYEGIDNFTFEFNE